MKREAPRVDESGQSRRTVDDHELGGTAGRDLIPQVAARDPVRQSRSRPTIERPALEPFILAPHEARRALAQKREKNIGHPAVIRKELAPRGASARPGRTLLVDECQAPALDFEQALGHWTSPQGRVDAE